MKKGLNLRLWEGIASRPNGCIVSHLQYANDTIIFCPPSLEYLCNIKKNLIAFHVASGLSVNFHKSAIYGINVDESWLKKAVELSLLWRIGSLPSNTLGFQLEVTPLDLIYRTLFFIEWIKSLQQGKERHSQWGATLLWSKRPSQVFPSILCPFSLFRKVS